MLMSQSQNQEWIQLKKAIDTYSEATGAEIAVVASHCNDNSLDSTQTEVYGHGGLYLRVKKNLHSVIGASTNVQYSLKEDYSMPNRQDLIHQNNSTTDSLSQSFRTLKLDMDPNLMQTGGSSSFSQSSTFSSPDEISRRNLRKIPTTSRRRRKPKTLNSAANLDFELDDELLFGENSLDEAEEDSSDLSDQSFDDELCEDNHSRRYSTPSKQPMYAASVPVNINLAWGHNSEMKFRDNEGPHVPYNTDAVTRPKLITAEKTPQLDTMMASMQALARSVTDDSALIFGERPRPRLKNSGNNRVF